jgi:hypothetical protein
MVAPRKTSSETSRAGPLGQQQRRLARDLLVERRVDQQQRRGRDRRDVAARVHLLEPPAREAGQRVAAQPVAHRQVRLEEAGQVRAAVVERHAAEDPVAPGHGGEGHAEAHAHQPDARGVDLRLRGQVVRRAAEQPGHLPRRATDRRQRADPLPRRDARREGLRVLDRQHRRLQRTRDQRRRLPPTRSAAASPPRTRPPPNDALHPAGGVRLLSSRFASRQSVGIRRIVAPRLSWPGAAVCIVPLPPPSPSSSPPALLPGLASMGTLRFAHPTPEPRPLAFRSSLLASPGLLRPARRGPANNTAAPRSARIAIIAPTPPRRCAPRHPSPGLVPLANCRSGSERAPRGPPHPARQGSPPSPRKGERGCHEGVLPGLPSPLAGEGSGEGGLPAGEGSGGGTSRARLATGTGGRTNSPAVSSPGGFEGASIGAGGRLRPARTISEVESGPIPAPCE